MSKNFELMQRTSERASQPVPATAMPRDLGWPTYPAQTEAPDSEAETGGWLHTLGVLKRRWRPCLLFALLIAAGVAVAAFVIKPVYVPEARLEVDLPGSEEIMLQNREGGGAPEFVEAQAQNLQSDGLALGVIRALHLDANPDFGGRVEQAAVMPRQSGDHTVWLTPAEDHALTVFTKARKVTLDPASRLITVSVASHDAALAAQITNTLVKQFVAADFKARSDTISQWQQQLDDIRDRMAASNHALASFQNSSGFSAFGDNQNTFSESVIELSKQLAQAQADRIQLQAYLDKLNSGKPPDGSLPQMSSDPVVQQLTTQLAETKAQLAQTMAVYGPNHPNSRKLQNEANELQSQLNAQRSAILNNMETSYTASKAREVLLSSQMAGAKKQMLVLAQYNELKRESDANTQLYAALYQRIKEAEIATNAKSSSIRIVDWARVLYLPTQPKRVQVIALGAFGGLMGGIMLAFLLEGLDTRIRNPEDLRRYLGAESVSVMPVIGKGARGMLSAGGRLLSAKSRRDSNIFLLDRPNSPESEALRGIYASVRLSWRNSGGRARVARMLMVTSALPGEGKTILSVNLALALAQHGKTCIVDADLRKGVVAPMLGFSNRRGLADVLSGSVALDEALVAHGSVPGLTLLPAGTVAVEPGVLIGSDAMSEAIGKLREKFEFVVIDSSPILPIADARMLSVLVDSILLVGRSGVTKRAEMKRATEILREVHSAPVLEFVLNAASHPGIGYGYYGHGNGNSNGNGNGRKVPSAG